MGLWVTSIHTACHGSNGPLGGVVAGRSMDILLMALHGLVPGEASLCVSAAPPLCGTKGGSLILLTSTLRHGMAMGRSLDIFYLFICIDVLLTYVYATVYLMPSQARTGHQIL